MRANHLEILVEERSMEALLQEILPAILGKEASFAIHPFRCKNDLLAKLPQRLESYAGFLPDDWRIVVIVDRDNDDCRDLKQRLEEMASAVGLTARTSQSREKPWQLVNRIAIEELESWYFGEWDAVRKAYPRVPQHLRRRKNFHDPDAIAGGTWEAFERVMQRAGYFREGLRKTKAAQAIGREMTPCRNKSRSFQVLREALLDC
ncbi:MAG: DUF4276 family protein [Magnetococcales bacterium]|nr:DUF4276 family protein [Magnetococcales bacterium]